MLAFDMPIPFSTFGKRNTTNVPAQSLTMLNDSLVVQQSAVWAGNLVALHGLDVDEKIDHIYLTALSRLPTEEERGQCDRIYPSTGQWLWTLGGRGFRRFEILGCLLPRSTEP